MTAVFLGVFLIFSGVMSSEKININTAGLEELDSLPGIGPSKAQAIIDYRTENGLFESIEDIINVSGIGEVTFNNIKDLITVGGDGVVEGAELVVINEVLPNPSGSDDAEWIELKNIGEGEVNLEGWRVADLSKEYVISGDDFGSMVIGAGGFFVLDKRVTGIALNNSGGESVFLYNSQGGLVWQVSYSGSAKDNMSWARDASGEYGWTGSLSKGEENVIVEEESSPVSEPSSSQEGNRYEGYILINEFLANPFGIDDNEWIELYNTSTKVINLDGWVLKDRDGEFELEGEIEPGDFLVVERSESELVLNNIGGDYIELIDKYGDRVDRVSYTKKVVEGESYNWCSNLGKWFWLEEVSAGEVNKCPLDNDEPVAYFEVEGGELLVSDYVWLDARESYDKDGEIVKYIWEFEREVSVMGEKRLVFEFFEPKVEVKFLGSGEMKINLRVVDNLGGIDEYEVEIEVVGVSVEVGPGEIYINKFLADPAGDDSQGEWIELCSGREMDIDLIGFKLDDEEGGSSPYGLDDYVLGGLSCILVMRIESGIALNNNEDKVRLIDSQGNLIDEVSYTGAKSGLVYSRMEEGWEWLGQVDEGVDLWLKLGSLSEVRGMEGGSLVVVGGWVAAEPGLLGKTIFYIIDEGSGVQIYSYKKDFPLLVVGDRVEIRGEVVDYQGETRIKIQTQDDILNLGKGKLPEVKEIQIEDVGEDLEGRLVKIKGELTEIKGSSWWVDDMTEEVKVYIKQNTQIKKGDIEVGDSLEIVGLISEWQGEYRVLPRYWSDISVVGRIEGETVSFDELGEVKEGNELFKYLFVIVVAVVIVLISIIIRIKGKKLIDRDGEI